MIRDYDMIMPQAGNLRNMIMRYLFLILMTGCSVKYPPVNYQDNFDYSESIAYDCYHNSEMIDNHCEKSNNK